MEKKSFEKYNKKQLFQLYQDIINNQITDKRLIKTRDALKNILSLMQFDYNSFLYLINYIQGLNDNEIDNISNGYFNNFYKLYSNYNTNILNNNMVLKLLSVFYSDYESISNHKDYEYLRNGMSYIQDIYKYNDINLEKSIKDINPQLNELLRVSFYNININGKRNLENDIEARDNIKTHLLIVFMMHKESYNNSYDLPINLLNYMINNLSEDSIIRMNDYISRNPSGIMMFKELLDAYYLEYNDELNNYLNSSIERIKRIEKGAS